MTNGVEKIKAMTLHERMLLFKPKNEEKKLENKYKSVFDINIELDSNSYSLDHLLETISEDMFKLLQSKSKLRTAAFSPVIAGLLPGVGFLQLYTI